MKNELGLRNVGVFIQEKVWLEPNLFLYEDRTECSETSAYKIQMPGNYPEESIQHSEHGESLKSTDMFYSHYDQSQLTLCDSRLPPWCK